MGFKVEGLLSDEQFLSAMERAVDKTAARALSRGKREAPVDTGELRDSGTLGKAVRKGTEIEAEVEFTADHASFINDGHMSADGKFVAPRPYLTNAIKEADANLGGEVAHKLIKLGCTRVDVF